MKLYVKKMQKNTENENNLQKRLCLFQNWIEVVCVILFSFSR